jgi:hypothetical protein
MREIIHSMTSEYTRRKYTQNIFLKLALGCISLAFIALCLGSLLLVYFMR